MECHSSLDPIDAKLAYLPTADGLRLVWNMPFAHADNAIGYDMSVDAYSGATLQAFDWVDHATYDVFCAAHRRAQMKARARW